MSDDAITEGPAQSLAQQRQTLWADPQQRLYALVLGSKVPGLRERVAQATVDDWDGLWPGELDAAERTAAPLLITLRRDSPFTDWLLTEAATAFPGWGALAQSRQGFLAMRSHARALCRARLPNGQAIRLDWMDPQVLEAVLPVAPAEQLQRVFDGIDALVTVDPGRWTRWSASVGRLMRQASAVLA